MCFSLLCSSKSTEAEASSIGTKTTLEADLSPPNNTNLKQSTSHNEKGAETMEYSVNNNAVKNNESTSVSSTAMIHMPPSKASGKKVKGKKDVPK